MELKRYFIYHSGFTTHWRGQPPSGADPYSGISRYQADWGQGTIMDYGPLQRPGTNMQYMAGRADLWGGYSGGHWYNFEPWRGPGGGGYGFNADGDYDTGAGYGGFTGMAGRTAANIWRRWKLKSMLVKAWNNTPANNSSVTKYKNGKVISSTTTTTEEGLQVVAQSIAEYYVRFGGWTKTKIARDYAAKQYAKYQRYLELIRQQAYGGSLAAGGLGDATFYAFIKKQMELDLWGDEQNVASSQVAKTDPWYDISSWKLVAWSIGVDLDVVLLIGSDESPISIGTILAGNDEGKGFLLTDAGWPAYGIDVSGAGELTFYFYTGDVNDFKLSSLAGSRFEANIGISAGWDFGAGFVVGDPDEFGGRVIAVKGFVGAGIPTVIGGNINWGDAFIQKVFKK